VQLLELSFPVHDYVSAVRAGREIAPPAARPARLLLFRRDYVVRRREVAAWQFALLQALQSGATLADALSQAANVADAPIDLSIVLFDVFAEWARDGLFRAMHASQPRP
jgi:hypothetical protein